MRKLIEGILEFRRHVFPAYRMTFAKLASSQSPDCLFLACSDSRVVPNLFASTNPGDLFVQRNVGNVVAPESASDQSVGATLEFALKALGVKDIVVCGHSNCGAMKAILSGQLPDGTPKLSGWLDHGRPSLDRVNSIPAREGLPDYDRLSQANVLQQLEHLKTYPVVQEALAKGAVRLHGWWFDIGKADVYAWEPDQGFVLMDETEAQRVLDRLNEPAVA